MSGYPAHTFTLAEASGDTRATFIRRTYLHLVVAIAAFVGVEAFLLSLDLTRELTISLLETQYGWLGILAAFALVGWIARGMASSGSRNTQYAGLGLYVVIEAIIFAPLLLIASAYAGGGAMILQAALMTGVLFAGLTATVFVTRTDFSFLRTFLMVGGFIALGMIVCGVLFGFDLGLWFSAGMVIFASAAILYDTSKILHHYREDQYVGAALELFASVALLFWYILRILMKLRD